MEYAKKLQLTDMDFKNDKPNAKSSIYYFNVDLKFILKARMHLLGKAFDDKILKTRKDGHKYKCDSCVDGE